MTTRSFTNLMLLYTVIIAALVVWIGWSAVSAYRDAVAIPPHVVKAVEAGPLVIDDYALLWAIAEKESGNDPQAVHRNAAGVITARTKWQFTRGTWDDTMHRLGLTTPFEQAGTDIERDALAAHERLAYCRERLKARSLPISVRTLAESWRHGPDFIGINPAKEPEEYAQAVLNLYAFRITR